MSHFWTHWVPIAIPVAENLWARKKFHLKFVTPFTSVLDVCPSSDEQDETQDILRARHSFTCKAVKKPSNLHCFLFLLAALQLRSLRINLNIQIRVRCWYFCFPEDRTTPAVSYDVCDDFPKFVDGDSASNEIIMSQGILKGIHPLQFRNCKYLLMSSLVARM